MDHSYACEPKPCSSISTSTTGLTVRILQHGKCIICSEDSDEKLTVINLGLNKIRDSAVIRNDSELIAYLDSNFERAGYIHETCRRQFNKTDRLVEDQEQKKQLEMRNARTTRCLTGGFDSRTMYMLCGKPVDLTKQKLRGERLKRIL
jgi:hypothetical protein